MPWSALTNFQRDKTNVDRELSIAPVHFHKRSQLFMSAHDEPLSAAMRVLLPLSAVVENEYER